MVTKRSYAASLLCLAHHAVRLWCSPIPWSRGAINSVQIHWDCPLFLSSFQIRWPSSNPCHYIHGYRFFFGHFFSTVFLVVCARPLSLTKVFLPPLSTRLVTGTRHFSCVRLYMCACDDDDCFYYHSWRNNVVIAFGTLSSFCVCLCLCMWRCVKKETNCKKY